MFVEFSSEMESSELSSTVTPIVSHSVKPIKMNVFLRCTYMQMLVVICFNVGAVIVGAMLK